MEPLTIFFIFLLFVVVSILWTNYLGAPWAPTSLSKINTMLTMAEVGENDLVYDLGCGDGRIIVTAAVRFRARAVGFEIDPLRYLWCQIIITVLGIRDRVQVIYGNFFQQDLSPASVVTCYLLPDTNIKLEKKLMSELQSGTRVVSHSFLFPGLNPVVKDYKKKIYYYQI